jgi:cell division cycle 20-like protein 1 (cofactor of APC complex)
MSARQRATEAMEAEALNRRLKEIENAGRQRERTPGRSPSRKRQRTYGDR